MESAKTLIPLTYFAPSLHCSYYSCVQFMLHIFLVDFGLNKSKLSDRYIVWKERVREQREKDKADGKKEKIQEFGLHNFYINLMYAKLIEKDAVDCQTFYETINRLKGLRHKADYHDNEISSDEATNGFTTAENTLTLLQKHFAK